MPAGSLHFLRPLYDIARWQYLLMAGKCTKENRNQKVKMTEREHEIIANFLCKLLSLPAYSHLMDLLVNDDAQKACGSWNVGQKPTEKLVR